MKDYQFITFFVELLEGNVKWLLWLFGTVNTYDEISWNVNFVSILVFFCSGLPTGPESIHIIIIKFWIWFLLPSWVKPSPIIYIKGRFFWLWSYILQALYLVLSCGMISSGILSRLALLRPLLPSWFESTSSFFTSRLWFLLITVWLALPFWLLLIICIFLPLIVKLYNLCSKIGITVGWKPLLSWLSNSEDSSSSFSLAFFSHFKLLTNNKI